jgi:hypothetical protein
VALKIRAQHSVDTALPSLPLGFKLVQHIGIEPDACMHFGPSIGQDNARVLPETLINSVAGSLRPGRRFALVTQGPRFFKSKRSGG